MERVGLNFLEACVLSGNAVCSRELSTFELHVSITPGFNLLVAGLLWENNTKRQSLPERQHFATAPFFCLPVFNLLPSWLSRVPRFTVAGVGILTVSLDKCQTSEPIQPQGYYQPGLIFVVNSWNRTGNIVPS